MAVIAADQITVVDLTDGYSVNLSNDSYTFVGDQDGIIATQQSTTTVIQALRGSDEPTVSVDTSEIIAPEGITVSYDSSTKALTITATASVDSSGVVTIPVVLDGDVTIEKMFSFAISKAGADGEQGADGRGVVSADVEYQVGTSATTAPTGTWSSTPVATTAAGQYLWTRTTTHYTSGSDTVSYSVSAHGAKGNQGDPGSDAINVVLTSSAGTIFKNAAIASVITAHVYMAGAEVTGTALSNLGSFSWKIDGTAAPSSKVSGTANNTLTISAGDVGNKTTILAELN